MMWYLMLMCLVHQWNSRFRTNQITTWLLIHYSIGVIFLYPRSPNNLPIWVISLVITRATRYLAFVVLPIVQSYFREPHAIGPSLSVSRKLDWNFQSFKSMAKFASHYECKTWLLLLPLYVIFIKIVSSKYFMMHFNATICCICGFLVNLASCATTNEMSQLCKL